MSRPVGVASPEGIPLFFTNLLGDNDFLRGHAYYFPVCLKALPKKGKNKEGQNTLFDEGKVIGGSLKANLSPAARSYLAALGLPDPDADTDTAALIWMHALAVGYSPDYLSENADGVRQDWPRTPLPDKAEVLENSARLGRELAQLLDTESPAPGVTVGNLRSEMKVLGVVSRVGGGGLNPEAGDLALKARWGYGGKGGITMPGKGRAVERAYTPEEREAIREGAAALGLTLEEALKRLGESTFDIYLNEVAFWQNVPAKVWNYYIGGYQVIKKWLSYRELPLLGRPLTTDEAREVTHMARRLAAIVLMEPALNANYQTMKASCYPWPQS
jgi:hypothetical protein